MKTISLAIAFLTVALPYFAQNNPTPAATFNLPAGQGLVAKLTADLDATKVKPGDVIQVQVIQDLRQGHTTLLKKGSTVSGKIVKVELFSSGSPSSIVLILDQVTPSGGSAESFSARMGALSPPPEIQTDSLQEGRGRAQTDTNAANSGGKNVSNGYELSGGSVGVRGIKGVTLASTTDAGKLYSIIQSSIGDVKLKKGSELVLNLPAE
ncbi:MAG TPA: hypothetical protein VGD60_14775 [Candidatus Acidoferrales bacterium]